VRVTADGGWTLITFGRLAVALPAGAPGARLKT
jgi:hypothetical protein